MLSRMRSNKLFLAIVRGLVSRSIECLKVQHGDFISFVYFEYFQKRGFNIVANHFYQPIPEFSEINWRRLKESKLTGLKINEVKLLNLLNLEFRKYGNEFSMFKNIKPEVDSQNDPHFYFNNLAFDGVDALVYYSMIRKLNPKQVLEIGSGWSTKIAAAASLLNKNTKLFSVEPYPQPILEKGFPGLTKLIKKKVENLPLSYFDKLESGDILFIDSSHTVKTGGDVNYLILDIIPRLKKGVYIHFHDIFLPI